MPKVPEKTDEKKSVVATSKGVQEVQNPKPQQRPKEESTKPEEKAEEKDVTPDDVFDDPKNQKVELEEQETGVPEEFRVTPDGEKPIATKSKKSSAPEQSIFDGEGPFPNRTALGPESDSNLVTITILRSQDPPPTVGNYKWFQKHGKFEQGKVVNGVPREVAQILQEIHAVNIVG